jgi:murein tripeptide amidase MpaA
LKIGRAGRAKPVVWIDGGIHAREWISPAAVSYMAFQLLENSECHEDILNNYDIYVMPIVNPDG